MTAVRPGCMSVQGVNICGDVLSDCIANHNNCLCSWIKPGAKGNGTLLMVWQKVPLSLSSGRSCRIGIGEGFCKAQFLTGFHGDEL